MPLTKKSKIKTGAKKTTGPKKGRGFKVEKKSQLKTSGKKIIKTKKKLLKKRGGRSRKLLKTLKLKRAEHNPIINPRHYSWESEAVLNPAAVLSDGRVHLFYRALGYDGVSRIGYASSKDGINFDERLSYPVYFVKNSEEMKKHWPYTSPARPAYDT